MTVTTQSFITVHKLTRDNDEVAILVNTAHILTVTDMSHRTDNSAGAVIALRNNPHDIWCLEDLDTIERNIKAASTTKPAVRRTRK